jgi:hypothetical protein
VLRQPAESVAANSRAYSSGTWAAMSRNSLLGDHLAQRGEHGAGVVGRVVAVDALARRDVVEELVEVHGDRVAALAQAAVERVVQVARDLLPEVLDLARRDAHGEGLQHRLGCLARLLAFDARELRDAQREVVGLPRGAVAPDPGGVRQRLEVLRELGRHVAQLARATATPKATNTARAWAAAVPVSTASRSATRR